MENQTVLRNYTTATLLDFKLEITLWGLYGKKGLEGRRIGSRETNPDNTNESLSKDRGTVGGYTGEKTEMSQWSLLNN